MYPFANLPAFDIAMPGHIVFGRGKALQSLPAIRASGNHFLLVHGSDPTRAEWLATALAEAGAFLTLASCAGEPDLAMIEEAVALARKMGVDAVISLGGGAVIDFGKAVAALACASGETLDYLEVVGRGLPLDADPLPFIALPTTAGTGAEVTRNAVIAIPEHRRKVSLRDNRMIAKLAIIDPALTDNLPKTVTLASGLDAVTQVIEPFLSLKANPFTDALSAQAIPLGIAALRQLMNGEDKRARDNMAFVSLCGGLALANSGLGAVHGFAGVIGGMTGAPHGEICACLLPETLETNARALKRHDMDCQRINQIDTWLSEGFGQYRGDNGFQKLKTWSRDHGIRTIGELGVKARNFAEIAELSKASSSMKGNPVPLENEELMEILEHS